MAAPNQARRPTNLGHIMQSTVAQPTPPISAGTRVLFRSAMQEHEAEVMAYAASTKTYDIALVERRALKSELQGIIADGNYVKYLHGDAEFEAQVTVANVPNKPTTAFVRVWHRGVDRALLRLLDDNDNADEEETVDGARKKAAAAAAAVDARIGDLWSKPLSAVAAAAAAEPRGAREPYH